MSSINLDSLKTYHQYDQNDQYESLLKFGRNFERGFHESQLNPLPIELSQISSLLICTDGQSRYVADFAASLTPFFLRTPFEIITSFRLPGYTNEKTLTLIFSTEKNSEEINSIVSESESKNNPCVCLLPIGETQFLAKNKNLEIVEYQNLPHALGFLFGFFARLNPATAKTINIEEISTTIEKTVVRLNREIEEKLNPAKTVSQKHSQKAILVLASGHLQGVANLFSGLVVKWSRTFSQSYSLADISKNIESLVTYPTKVLNEYQVVILTSDLYPQATIKQLELTKEILTKKRVNYSILKPDSDDWFNQIFESVVFFVFFSYYLSIVNKVNI